MTRLEHTAYIDKIRADGRLLAQAASDGLEHAVPACPGWNVREVVKHTGSVYLHKIAAIRLQRRPLDGEWEREPSRWQDLLAWFNESHAALLDELASRDQHDASYTWWPPDQTIGFWSRRMALETVVHRVDVESARGVQSPVDVALAVDGIDEVLQVFLTSEEYPAVPSDRLGSVAVRSGDVEWKVLLESQAARVEPGTAGFDVDASVSGDPEDVFLYLWGRVPAQQVRREGVTAVIDTLRRRLVAATQ